MRPSIIFISSMIHPSLLGQKCIFETLVQFVKQAIAYTVENIPTNK